MKTILIRYGELTLKGKNRSQFERTLINNLRMQVNQFDVLIKKDRNRIYINLNNEQQYYNLEKVLLKIPGIDSFSIAQECALDLEKIKVDVIKNFNQKQLNFKIETKRGNKNFPLESHQISRAIGAHVLKTFNHLDLTVKMKNAEQIIYLEIQKTKAYIFHHTKRAMGGLPIGTAGNGLVLLSGGIDSPVAAILAMKRGIKINLIHFTTPPFTSHASIEKVEQLYKILLAYDQTIKLYHANITPIQLQIKKIAMPKYHITLLRRMMMKQAEILAQKIKVEVLITGEALGQVASQTMSGINCSNQAVKMLIIRPLIAMDKIQIIDLAQQFETYETSILPYEDCCSLFVPKNPSTNPKLELVKIQEDMLNYEGILEQLVINKRTIKNM